MRYLITRQGWAAGPQGFVPAGTIIDTSTLEGTPFVSINPPPGAQALDQAAYDVLAQLYPANVIMSDVGINRWKDPLG
jgi:hypothetical protein